MNARSLLLSPLALSALLTSTLLCAGALSAHAQQCRCPQGRAGLDLATHRSPIVVYGEVHSFEEVDEFTWVAKIEVGRGYKGSFEEGDEIAVYTGYGEDRCGVTFTPGRSFLMFIERSEGRLRASSCDPNEQLDVAPIGPQVRSLAPVPPGKGRVVERASRANHVFIGEVTEAGDGFAGSWHGSGLKVRVTRPFKNTKKNQKIEIGFDELTCRGGRITNNLLAEDIPGSTKGAPFIKEKLYLFYTYGENPVSITPCHGNFVEESAAGDQIKKLSALCGTSRTCNDLGRGWSDAARHREALSRSALAMTKQSISQCAARTAMFSGKKGSITKVDWRLNLRPQGKVDLLAVETEGSLEDASVYDAVSACLADSVSSWSIESFPGEPLEVEVTQRFRDKSSAPRYEASQIRFVYNDE